MGAPLSVNAPEHRTSIAARIRDQRGRQEQAVVRGAYLLTDLPTHPPHLRPLPQGTTSSLYDMCMMCGHMHSYRLPQGTDSHPMSRRYCSSRLRMQLSNRGRGGVARGGHGNEEGWAWCRAKAMQRQHMNPPSQTSSVSTPWHQSNIKQVWATVTAHILHS